MLIGGSAKRCDENLKTTQQNAKFQSSTIRNIFKANTIVQNRALGNLFAYLYMKLYI